MELEIDCADICLPDFWQGTKLPHIAVAIDNTMSMRDMLEAAHREVGAGAIGGDVMPYECAFDSQWCAAAHAAIDVLHSAAIRNSMLDTIVAPNVQPSEDVHVYAYLVFHRVTDEPNNHHNMEH